MPKRPIGKSDAKKFIVEHKYWTNRHLWPNTTIALSTVNSNLADPTAHNVYQNEPGKHVERFFLEKLQELSQNEELVEITANLVQNYSPCATCADEIVNFKKTMEERQRSFSLTIQFSSFYNHDDNREGLKNLVKNKIIFKKVFQGEKDWDKFLKNDNFVTLTTDDKQELLKMAKSDARRKREENDNEILNDIIGEAKDNKAIFSSNKININISDNIAFIMLHETKYCMIFSWT